MNFNKNRKRNRAISGQLRSISDLSGRGVLSTDMKGQLKEWVIQGDRRALEFLNLHEDDNNHVRTVGCR